ncbi:hypothetical protein [Mucilaginibacter jinjuensis]|uniref:Uncharacterized protein n=1 Tax=Mucilaginibacter jinjuensis TaxID=1176721 RepID=A0ABY7T313_9SPHI|nr:hypothetical protein [Mucilaginibacter jinjuensis]WCT10835.1 hypothetical protein PQO05_19040 [Mucilaginibacter jinjuensis]
MATPKKPEKNNAASKNTAPNKAEKPADPKAKKRSLDDDDDDFDASYDDLDYDQLQDFDEDDDY